MKVGIDARFLTHPQRGGFKTYTENLIQSICDVDENNQYTIYIDRPLSNSMKLLKKDWDYKFVPGYFPLIGMPLREQFFSVKTKE